MKKREPFCSVGGMQIGADTMENNIAEPQKIKTELPYDPTVPLLSILLKKTKALTWKHICTMFTAALFIIAKIWKQPECPPKGEWRKCFTHTHTHTHKMEYHSAIKKNEIVSFVTTQMDHEIAQRKTNTVLSHFMWNLGKKDKLIDTNS